ncbi:hypothetical protein [Bradyrhizobium sp. WSM471]|uniref:hypothetical protein n=1 Tax=Bradyrhizobium sp. WSM471 TaxID=319017 RepID=UPI00055B9E37|nr:MULTISPECIES: hypothetical protein [Bradyrhizobium]UFW39763.1 hypothetical protein BcanWSM471_26575 [Bradyrhizobium canariense]
MLSVISTLFILVAPELIYRAGLNQERLVLDASAGDPLSWAALKYEVFSFLTPALRERMNITWTSWGIADVSGSAVVQCVVILATATALMG